MARQDERSLLVILLMSHLAVCGSDQRIVSAEENERYTNIIDDILAKADLETISRKRIRQGLQDALGGIDLSEQKVCAQRSCRSVEDQVREC